MGYWLAGVPHNKIFLQGGVYLALVVQRPDNFIQWTSHYPTVSICAKISVFPRLQANMHTLTTAKFGSVRKPWTVFNVKYILDPKYRTVVPYPLDKVIRPVTQLGPHLNNSYTFSEIQSFWNP